MRLQLALDVSDIDEAVDFYSKLFGAEPAKRKPGYANFAIENPPLKLVLFENPDNAGGLNHLGVETETSQQVEAAEARMDASGLDTTGVNDNVCCYAGKTETWVVGPDGARWEWYVKTTDEADFGTDEIAEFKSGKTMAEFALGDGRACCG